MSSAQSSRMLVGLNAAHSGSSSTWVYLGQTPDRFFYEAQEVLAWSQPAAAVVLRAPLAATIERQGRAAATLGARFTPDPHTSTLRIELAVALVQEEGANVSGIPMWAANAVLKGMRRTADLSPMTALGPGLLRLQWGRWHEVDSSEWGFALLGEQLVPLLFLNADATQDDVTESWIAQKEEREASYAGMLPEKDTRHHE